MGSALFELATVVLAAWLVWRLISQRLRLPGQAAEPGRDDFAGVPARLRPKPKSGAGAVALAEPGDDETDPENLDSATSQRARGQWRGGGAEGWTRI